VKRTPSLAGWRGPLFLGGVAALLFFTAFPFAWMIATAFKAPREIFVSPPTFFPHELTLANLARLFAETRFATYLANSATVASGTVLLTLAIATPGAYGLTRFRFRGRETISATILFTYMFAPIMIIIPFYVLMRTLGLANTRLGLVLAYTAFCLPFALWLLRTFFQAIPLELEEAAMTDGASRLQSVLHVVLPLALPGVVATGIFTFILAWNDYIFARVLISADELKTMPVGIADLYNASVVDWGMIMSAGMLVLLPVLAVFVFIQRYMVAGWGTGGVKG
jgi:ABC-type glycerol-3-phosphate transport system permease component